MDLEKNERDINKKYGICIFGDCKKGASYNIEGETKRLYCSTHKEENMISLKCRKCLECYKEPCFNLEGEKRGIYCDEHKKVNMINVKSPKCLDCKSRPYYNFEGETTAIYCAEHKKDNMVNVCSKKCLECDTVATFNYEGKKGRLYCDEHKKENMVKITNSYCLDCKSQPSHNFEGETTALYCAKHKKDGMINIISKKCLKCNTVPSFNVEGETLGIYCKTHKLEKMINVTQKTCLICDTQASYNYKGEKTSLFCAEHKKENMICIRSKSCKNELCSTLIANNNKNEDYCFRCFVNLFPDKPITINYKTKEFAVAEFVKTTFPDKKWICDKKITGGSSRRRPDLLLELGEQIIITDIDENQHKCYDENDDKNRTAEILQDIGNKSVIFIRFNPDDYIDKDNTKIKSCWSITRKTGLVEINNKKNWVSGLCPLYYGGPTDPREERLNVLKNKIQYWIDNKTENPVETVYLFYDEKL
jgi:hypothetical protein